MPKIPRNISGNKFIKILSKFGYIKTRQSGSHIRLTSKYKEKDHNITIPAHQDLKIGTLNNILKDIANYLKIDKNELIKKLF
ncbi:MAG: type II toxin-antitoxin system HicA family toxin [Spirochaetes bacterium]|nr:type II toxin-antitoxin system HicA family toxin [Spirochaetota bacterium]